jgi:hypothetical protein
VLPYVQLFVRIVARRLLPLMSLPPSIDTGREYCVVSVLPIYLHGNFGVLQSVHEPRRRQKQGIAFPYVMTAFNGLRYLSLVMHNPGCACEDGLVKQAITGLPR